MSFHVLPRATVPGKAPRTSSVKVGIYRGYATFTITPDIAGQIGVSRGDRVILMTGTGEHAGYVAIQKVARTDRDGRTVGISGKRLLAIRISAERLGISGGKSVRLLPHRIDGDTLIVNANVGFAPVARERVSRSRHLEAISA